MICTKCGMVYPVMVHPDRDAFSDSQRSSGIEIDMHRSAPHHTTILPTKGVAATKVKTMQRIHMQTVQSPSDRRYTKIALLIETIADRMGFNQRLRNAAKDVYAQIVRTHPKKTKKDELLAAVCIGIACRNLKFPRSFKDIAGGCTNVSRKELGRAFKLFSRTIGTKNNHVDLKKMVPRFASVVGFHRRDMMLCEHIAAMIDRHGWVPGRNPLSTIAGALMLAARSKAMYDEFSPLLIATALGIAENTVRKAFRDVVPHAGRLLNARLIAKHELERTTVDALRKDVEYVSSPSL